MAATTLHGNNAGPAATTWFTPTFGTNSVPAAFQPNFSLGDDANRLYTAPRPPKRKFSNGSVQLPHHFYPNIPNKRFAAQLPVASVKGMVQFQTPRAVAAYGDRLEEHVRTIGYDAQTKIVADDVIASFGTLNQSITAQEETNAQLSAIDQVLQANAARADANAAQAAAGNAETNDLLRGLANEAGVIAQNSELIVQNTGTQLEGTAALEKQLVFIGNAIANPPQPEVNDADKAGGILSGISKFFGTVAGVAAMVPGIGSVIGLGAGAISLAAGAGAAISKTVAAKQHGASDIGATATFFGEAATTIGNAAPGISANLTKRAAEQAAMKFPRPNLPTGPSPAGGRPPPAGAPPSRAQQAANAASSIGGAISGAAGSAPGTTGAGVGTQSEFGTEMQTRTREARPTAETNLDYMDARWAEPPEVRTGSVVPGGPGGPSTPSTRTPASAGGTVAPSARTGAGTPFGMDAADRTPAPPASAGGTVAPSARSGAGTPFQQLDDLIRPEARGTIPDAPALTTENAAVVRELFGPAPAPAPAPRTQPATTPKERELHGLGPLARAAAEAEAAQVLIRGNELSRHFQESWPITTAAALRELEMDTVEGAAVRDLERARRIRGEVSPPGPVANRTRAGRANAAAKKVARSIGGAFNFGGK